MAANEPHSSLSVPKLIAKKRDGGRLTRDEIAFFVRSVADNTIEGSQLGVSALRGRLTPHCCTVECVYS